MRVLGLKNMSPKSYTILHKTYRVRNSSSFFPHEGKIILSLISVYDRERFSSLNGLHSCSLLGSRDDRLYRQNKGQNKEQNSKQTANRLLQSKQTWSDGLLLLSDGQTAPEFAPGICDIFILVSASGRPAPTPRSLMLVSVSTRKLLTFLFISSRHYIATFETNTESTAA
jgi:hypothetical protein